jgi:hypothetical protein
MDRNSSHLKEEPRDQPGLARGLEATQLVASGTTNREYLKDGDMNKDTRRQGGGDGWPVQKGAVAGAANNGEAGTGQFIMANWKRVS